MSATSVQPKRCDVCVMPECAIKEVVIKEGYLVIVTQCPTCQKGFQNAYKLREGG